MRRKTHVKPANSDETKHNPEHDHGDHQDRDQEEDQDHYENQDDLDSEDGPSTSHCRLEWLALLCRNICDLEESFSFPAGFSIERPTERDTILDAPHGRISVYKAAFSCGLRFPLHPLLVKIFRAYDIAPAQIMPNSWATILSFIATCKLKGFPCTLNMFRFMHKLKSRKNCEGPCWYCFINRAKLLSAKSKPSSVKIWKNEFVYVLSKGGWQVPQWGKIDERPNHIDFRLSPQEQAGVNYFQSRRERVEGKNKILAVPVNWLPELHYFKDEQFLSACGLSRRFSQVKSLKDLDPKMKGTLNPKLIKQARAKELVARARAQLSVEQDMKKKGSLSHKLLMQARAKELLARAEVQPSVELNPKMMSALNPKLLKQARAQELVARARAHPSVGGKANTAPTMPCPAQVTTDCQTGAPQGVKASTPSTNTPTFECPVTHKVRVSTSPSPTISKRTQQFQTEEETLRSAKRTRLEVMGLRRQLKDTIDLTIHSCPRDPAKSISYLQGTSAERKRLVNKFNRFLVLDADKKMLDARGVDQLDDTLESTIETTIRVVNSIAYSYDSIKRVRKEAEERTTKAEEELKEIKADFLSLKQKAKQNEESKNQLIKQLALANSLVDEHMKKAEQLKKSLFDLEANKHSLEKVAKTQKSYCHKLKQELEATQDELKSVKEQLGGSKERVIEAYLQSSEYEKQRGADSVTSYNLGVAETLEKVRDILKELAPDLSWDAVRATYDDIDAAEAVALCSD